MNEADANASLARVLVQTLAFERAITPVGECADDKSFDVLTAPSGAIYRWEVLNTYGYGYRRPTPNWNCTREVGGVSEALAISTFVEELAPLIGMDLLADAERLAGFVSELRRTVANDVAAKAIRRTRTVNVDSDLDALEAAVIEAHPYHPCHKSRIGFDESDNRLYGPEFARPLQPVWVAVRDAEVTSSRFADYHELVRSQLTPERVTAFEDTLAARVGNADAYTWIPVHPWQFRRVIEPELIAGRVDGEVVALGAGNSYTPQQSLRTLQAANAETEDGISKKLSMKLSLSIVNTSTVRTLKPHTVRNAPMITEWLSAIVSEDPRMQALRPILLREVAGAAYRPESTLEISSGTLSCLWRESVHAHLDAGERAVPMTALQHVHPNGVPFIEPWVRRFGLDDWVQRVLTTTIAPLTQFLVGHGIALEAHAQNLCLAHRDGTPTRLVLRDFHDGIKFSPEHLARPELLPPLVSSPAAHLRTNPGSYIRTQDGSEVVRFAHDLQYFVGLAPFAWFLRDRYGYAEAKFWSIACDAVETEMALLAPQQRVPQLDPFRPTTLIGPLTLERLRNSEAISRIEVSNPLAVARRTRRSSSGIRDRKEHHVELQHS